MKIVKGNICITQKSKIHEYYMHCTSVLLKKVNCKLLNPKPSSVHPAPPLFIQANSEYLTFEETSWVGVSIIIIQKYSPSLSIALLRLAIYF